MCVVMLGGCSRLLYYPSDQYLHPADFKKAKLQPPEEVLFSSWDSTPLYGWYFKNKTRKIPRGLIVFFHGNASNISGHFPALYWILNQGYDYFIFDYEGYGKSQGKPSPRATINDGKAALCWAALHHPSVPLIVFGQSLGGAVALRTVSEVKDRIPIAYLAVDSTFSSYRAAARGVLAHHWLTWILQPIVYAVISDRYAPKGHIAEISPIPLLVLHGDQDQTVDFKLGKKVYELAKPPKEFIRVVGGRHIDAFWGHEGWYRREFIKQLNRITQNRVAISQMYSMERIRSYCELSKGHP